MRWREEGGRGGALACGLSVDPWLVRSTGGGRQLQRKTCLCLLTHNNRQIFIGFNFHLRRLFVLHAAEEV